MYVCELDMYLQGIALDHLVGGDAHIEVRRGVQLLLNRLDSFRAAAVIAEEKPQVRVARAANYACMYACMYVSCVYA